MASANPPVKQKTTCSTCKDVTCIPEMLPCSHTLCLESIEKFMSGKNGNPRTMPCPTCQVNFDIPSIWMLKQCLNRVIVEEITGPESASEMDASKKTECEVCLVIRKSKVPASSFCKVCRQVMCEQCSASHRGMKVSMTHTQIPIGEVVTTVLMKKKGRKKHPCNKHPDEEINFYCRQCSMIICLKCSLGDHSKHDICCIGDVAAECKTKVMDSCDEVSKLVIKMREKHELVDERLYSFLIDLDTSAKALVERTETIKRMAEIHANYLFRRLRVYHFLFGNITPLLQDDLLETIEKHKEFIKLCNSNVEDEDAVNICRIAGNLVETAAGLQMQSVHKLCDLPEILFLPSSDFDMSATANNMVGRILVNFPLENTVQGMTAMNQDMYIVYQGSSLVEVYDLYMFTYRQTFSVKGMSDPCDIVARHNVIHISDVTNNFIHRIKILDKSAVFSSWSAKSKQARISSTEKGNVVVSCRDLEKIFEYTSEGFLVHEIPTNPIEPTIPGLMHAVRLDDNQLLICHSSTNSDRVCIINNDGRLVRSYGCGKGSGIGPLICPSYLAVDPKKGFILVADTDNNRIVRLNRRLEYVDEVFPDSIGLKQPQKMHLHELTGWLCVVGPRGNHIWLYDLQTC